MNQQRILVVDDDRSIVKVVRSYDNWRELYGVPAR